MRIGLKVAILRSGKSQRQVGAEVQIPENRFSQIVRGWRTPTGDERRRIAAAVGCDVCLVFPEEGTDTPQGSVALLHAEG